MKKGLATKTSKEEVGPLLAIMQALHDIENNKDGIEKEMSRALATIDFLAQAGQNMHMQRGQLDSAQKEWVALEKDVPAVMAQVKPLVKIFSSRTEDEILEFEGSIRTYSQSFKKLELWDFDTGSLKARAAMEKANLEQQVRRVLRVTRI